MTRKKIRALGIAAILTAVIGAMVARPASAQDTAFKPPPPLPGPAPTERDVAYAKSDAATGQGHLLDLYLPKDRSKPVPVVIFTHGSAWMADNGKMDAQGLAAILVPRGYAVAGVSIRSSTQARFPAQVYDIKAAIRWLRSNAGKYGLDGGHIGIIGESSGGWTSAMAAVTGDVPELEGGEGVTGISSAVQAAIAFYPPTDFLQMDPAALRPCDPKAPASLTAPFCHTSAGSPESLLIGCALNSCPDAVERANPIRYISKADPPIMVIHGERDSAVPYGQGEMFYQALNKACHTASFLSLPIAGHGTWYQMMSDPSLAYGATIRSTSSDGCKVEIPQPVTPSWDMIVSFFDRYLKSR